MLLVQLLKLPIPVRNGQSQLSSAKLAQLILVLVCIVTQAEEHLIYNTAQIARNCACCTTASIRAIAILIPNNLPRVVNILWSVLGEYYAHEKLCGKKVH